MHKIEEIQHLIKEYGFNTDPRFKMVMDIDPTEDNIINAQYDYYKNIQDKILKDCGDTVVNYFIITAVNRVKYGASEKLRVTVNSYGLRVRDNNISIYTDIAHVLCSPYAGRYDNCVEISQEQFDKEWNAICAVANSAKEAFNNLKY